MPPELVTSALLQRIPFFASVDSKTLARLVPRCPVRQLAAGGILFQEGDPGDTLFVILAGEVEIIQTLDDAPVHLSTLRVGEYFGEMALLDDAPRSATVRAVTDSTLLQVRKQELIELLREYPQLFTDAARVLSARLRESNAQHVAELVRKNQELIESNRRLQLSYEATLAALSSALDLRDHATQGHSQRVAAYTLLIADALDVPQAERESLRLGALLHDIGKIGVPDAILRKSGALMADEWDEMKKHPEMGAAIVEKIEFLRAAREIVIAHHERFDGSGYPQGLRGNAIPLGARIFAIADVFDAVTTFRPYRMPLAPQEAVTLIERSASTHFDPNVVRAFVNVLPQMIDAMRASFEAS